MPSPPGATYNIIKCVVQDTRQGGRSGKRWNEKVVNENDCNTQHKKDLEPGGPINRHNNNKLGATASIFSPCPPPTITIYKGTVSTLYWTIRILSTSELKLILGLLLLLLFWRGRKDPIPLQLLLVITQRMLHICGKLPP